jgi:transposase
VAENFIEYGREQPFLLPPDLRDWLPENHLAWTVLDAVAEMDLFAFYADYRFDGRGRAAYDPRMMVAPLRYAYARRERSSRGIERECEEDVAYRVIAANHRPDDAAIARFICRHEGALAEVFGSVLAVCARAGLVKVGVIARRRRCHQHPSLPQCRPHPRPTGLSLARSTAGRCDSVRG